MSPPVDDQLTHRDQRLLIALRLGFDVLVAVVMAAALYSSTDFHDLARYFPVVITGFGLLLSTVNLALDLRRWRVRTGELLSEVQGTGGAMSQSTDAAQTSLGRALYYVAWLTSAAIAMWLLGVLAAIALFVVSFLIIEGRWRWFTAIAGAVVLMALMQALTVALNLRWPEALLPLHEYVGL